MPYSQIANVSIVVNATTQYPTRMLAAPSKKLQSSTVSVEAARRRFEIVTITPPVPMPEQREADDEVRVVVEELERDDPRVRDLEQQPREADQQDLEHVPAPRLAGACARTLGGQCTVPTT